MTPDEKAHLKSMIETAIPEVKVCVPCLNRLRARTARR